MMRFARVDIATGTPIRCARCEPADAGSLLALPEIESRLVRVWESAEESQSNLYLRGGEPLRHPELPHILRAAATMGFGRIALLTDAAGFTVGENAPGAIATGLTQIHVPMLGADAESHDRRAGAPGAFSATLSGIDAFVDAGQRMGTDVAVLGQCRVCRHVVAELPAIVSVLAAHGAVAVALDLEPDLGPHAGKWLSAAFETGMVNGAWVFLASGDAGAADIPAAMRIAPMTVDGGA